MRWPWVPRMMYDGACAMHEAMRTDYQEQRREWSEERASLLDRLAAMQRQGFRQPDPSLPPPASTDVLPAEVEAAIVATGMDPRGALARENARLATQWLATGMQPEAVARMIERGQDYE